MLAYATHTIMLDTHAVVLDTPATVLDTQPSVFNTTKCPSEVHGACLARGDSGRRLLMLAGSPDTSVARPARGTSGSKPESPKPYT